MKSQFLAVAGLFLATQAKAQDTLFSGTGFGTYYYDIQQVDACFTDFSNQNLGVVRCSPQVGLTLNAINSNYIVAMNNTQLSADLALYCGKKVNVYFDGVLSDLPLFIGDGCERCATGPSTLDVWNSTGAPGLDFSYSALTDLGGAAACNAGHISVTWEIVDELIFDFGF
jgi:hypothetical protein